MTTIKRILSDKEVSIHRNTVTSNMYNINTTVGYMVVIPPIAELHVTIIGLVYIARYSVFQILLKLRQKY